MGLIPTRSNDFDVVGLPREEFSRARVVVVTMQRSSATALVSISILVVVTGCSKLKSDDAAKPAREGETTSAAAPAALPFTGTLTGDRVMAARGLVKPFDDWAAAQAKLEAQLGPATRVNGKMYEWAVQEGDACTYVSVERSVGGIIGAAPGTATVGMVASPMRVEKNGPSMNMDQCLAVLGRGKPATDTLTTSAIAPKNAAHMGSAKAPVTVKSLRDGVAKDAAKWLDATATVKGVYVSSTTVTFNGKTQVTLSIADKKTDRDTVGCALAAGAADPGLKQGTPLKVEGRVTNVFGGRLSECTVVK